MLALVSLVALSVVAVYALGQVRLASTEPRAAGLVPGVLRGARALARLGASWRPVEHLRG